MSDSVQGSPKRTELESEPSRSTDLKKTLPEEAFNQLLQGKRSLLVQDYTSAVSSLATACELYTGHFGEVAIECAEVHFLYGKALFRLSQLQAGVLGGALNEEANDEEEEEEQDAENDDENAENDNENAENENAEKDNENIDKDNENVEKDNENATTEDKDSEPTDSPQGNLVDETPKENTILDATSDSNLKEKELEKQTENDNTEAEEDLELAWNCLETAKSIYLRQGVENKEAQLKVAEILQLLAEISMESDNNTAAMSDLKESLVIKEQHLTPDDRLLAETYYQMGLAQMLDKQYTEALEHFSRTQDILELRIKNLKNMPSDKEAGSWADIDRQKEIEDLEGVVADIKEKAEDTRELINTAKKDLEECLVKKERMEEAKFIDINSSETISKPVTNITHLLKRKKPDEEHKDTETKRIKIATGTQNGDTMVTE